MVKKILKKISERKIVVGVVGLGYVGLPLAKEFVKLDLKLSGLTLTPKRSYSCENRNHT